MYRENGEAIPAGACDISSSGMLVHPDLPISFAPGETVTVDVVLPDDREKSLSTWGIGRVVRLDGERTAIQLCAGRF